MIRNTRFPYLFHVVACAALLLASAQSQANLSFVFDYTSAPDFTAPRKAAFESAALSLGSFFTNTATLNFKVNSESVNNTTLASASSDSSSPAGAGFFRTVAQNKAISGVDSNGAAPDGDVNWNFFHNWDLDDSIAGNAFDFKSTVIHELCHALGFISYIGAAGSNTGNTNWTTFDQFLTNTSGADMINHSTFVFDTSKNSVITGGINGVRFSGSQAMAANSGTRISIFSPNPYQDGSSGSHLDDAFYTSANLLMESATDTGPGARTFSAIEAGIFRDLGYTLIPEPGSVLLLVMAGGALLCRRHRRATAAL